MWLRRGLSTQPLRLNFGAVQIFLGGFFAPLPHPGHGILGTLFICVARIFFIAIYFIAQLIIFLAQKTKQQFQPHGGVGCRKGSKNGHEGRNVLNAEQMRQARPKRQALRAANQHEFPPQHALDGLDEAEVPKQHGRELF